MKKPKKDKQLYINKLYIHIYIKTYIFKEIYIKHICKKYGKKLKTYCNYLLPNIYTRKKEKNTFKKIYKKWDILFILYNEKKWYIKQTLIYSHNIFI